MKRKPEPPNIPKKLFDAFRMPRASIKPLGRDHRNHNRWGVEANVEPASKQKKWYLIRTSKNSRTHEHRGLLIYRSQGDFLANQVPVLCLHTLYTKRDNNLSHGLEIHANHFDLPMQYHFLVAVLTAYSKLLEVACKVNVVRKFPDWSDLRNLPQV